jgi:hypothetical protein
LEPFEQARLVQPEGLARVRVGKGANVGEDGHLAPCVEGLCDPKRQLDGAFQQRLAAGTAIRRGAVGNVDGLAIPRRRQLVCHVEAVEEDAIDHGSCCEWADDSLDEEVASLTIRNVPDRIPALVCRRVAIPKPHLFAGAHRVDRAIVSLEHPVRVWFGHFSARLVVWAAVAGGADDIPRGGVVAVGVGKARISENGQLRVARLHNCGLIELGVDRGRPVGCRDQVLPSEDCERELADEVQLAWTLKVRGVGPEPCRRELVPVVGKREGHILVYLFVFVGDRANARGVNLIIVNHN